MRSVSIPSSSRHKWDSKTSGERRSNDELGERHDFESKRAKIRDLESVFRSEERNRNQLKFLKKNEDQNLHHCSTEEISQVTEGDLDGSVAVESGKNTFPIVVNPKNQLPDLNSELPTTPMDFDNTKPSFLGENDLNRIFSTGIGLDLTAEYVSSSAALQPKGSSSKNFYHSKSTGRLQERDWMRLWEEIKQNGFLSSSHGGIPIPKRRRKSKNNELKRQLALANEEQLTKITAPSGLLNDLNPEMINNVRNRKQVHSIIDALVNSEKLDIKSSSKDIEAMKGQARLLSSNGNESSDTLLGRRETREYTMPMPAPSLISEGQGGDQVPVELDGICSKKFASSSNSSCHEDELALRLSLASNAINSSTRSMEDSERFLSVSSQSVEAATVASRWLELLRQDIKGRLTALKSSKKRVRAVLNVELPFLITKDVSATQDNCSCSYEDSSDGIPDRGSANLRRTRWTTLFDHMNKALTEEEKQLESWLNDVKIMESHCVEGLQDSRSCPDHGFQLPGRAENGSRARKKTRSESELAVAAAAASIYSTCNFLMENT